MKSINWLMPAVVPLLSFGASAQTTDMDYCKALSQKYETYISNMQSIARRAQAPVGSVAIAQCKAGNTAAGIPVLERKLRDARIDLPPRG